MQRGQNQLKQRKMHWVKLGEPRQKLLKVTVSHNYRTWLILSASKANKCETITQEKLSSKSVIEVSQKTKSCRLSDWSCPKFQTFENCTLSACFGGISRTLRGMMGFSRNPGFQIQQRQLVSGLFPKDSSSLFVNSFLCVLSLFFLISSFLIYSFIKYVELQNGRHPGILSIPRQPCYWVYTALLTPAEDACEQGCGRKTVSERVTLGSAGRQWAHTMRVVRGRERTILLAKRWMESLWGWFYGFPS